MHDPQGYTLCPPWWKSVQQSSTAASKTSPVVKTADRVEYLKVLIKAPSVQAYFTRVMLYVGVYARLFVLVLKDQASLMIETYQTPIIDSGQRVYCKATNVTCHLYRCHSGLSYTRCRWRRREHPTSQRLQQDP